MAIGIIVAGGKKLVKKKLAQNAAAKMTTGQAARAATRSANLSRMEARERSTTTMAQDIRRGAQAMRQEAAGVTRAADRRMVGAGVGGGGALAATLAYEDRKKKKASPSVNRSRINRQRDR